MSNDIVARLTDTSPVVLLNVSIVYLLEDDSLDPWFIGTERCEVLTQQVTVPRRARKKLRRPGHPGQGDNRMTTKSSVALSNLQDSSPSRILDTQNQNSSSYAAHRPHYPGSTSSTTTVFQKLDTRSQLQTKTQRHAYQTNQPARDVP